MLFNKATTKFKNKKPVTFDGFFFDYLNSPNTISVWDGDQNLDLNSNWTDISTAFRLDFFGTLPLTGGSLNGHNTVIFNGTDQYGNSATPVIAQPHTVYLVMRQITHTVGRWLFNEGNTPGRNAIYQSGLSPKIIFDTDGDAVDTNLLTLNVWYVVTLLKNQIIRIDLNVGSNNFSSLYSMNGINLGCRPTYFDFFGNCEYAYIIMRNTADSTAIQNSIINQLKTRFAI